METFEWKDIGQEKWREYTFPGGHKIRIEAPAQLAVAVSGSHRIVTVDGKSHYIAKGFLHIEWEGPILF